MTDEEQRVVDLAEAAVTRAHAALATERERAAAAVTRADAAEADRDYWREQATGMAPSVVGMRALGTRLFPGGTGCVVDPERVVAEVERLRERVADAEAEAIRWGDAVVAIGEAAGLTGAGSAEIVAAVAALVTERNIARFEATKAKSDLADADLILEERERQLTEALHMIDEVNKNLASSNIVNIYPLVEGDKHE